MSGPGPRRRLSAGVLLAGAAGLAAVAARWLERTGETGPVRPGPALVAFAACLVLAASAGLLAGSGPGIPLREGWQPPSAPGGLRRVAACAAAIGSVLLLARACVLQDRPEHPVSAIAWWGGALLLGAIACALLSSGGRSGATRRRPSAALLAATLALLAAGAWCRLVALDDSPPIFGGDEANQVEDGLGLLRGTAPGDPFGTGWYGTMRLGMLPAGVGAFFSDDVIAGPRLPYAIAGALSLAASAGAAGLLGGPWAALGAAALLAFAPHHVHFSRLASVMILDAFGVAVFLLLAFAAARSGSPLSGFGAGAAAGLCLYGYSGGRIVPIAFLLTLPLLIFTSPAARGRRTLLAAALVAGFLVAALPSLRFAAREPREWSSRFQQVAIFRPDWWGPRVRELGSPAAVLREQTLAGTVGLLSRRSSWPWFTGYPIVAPYFLPALAAAGLGWLAGRRQTFAAVLLALVIAGNLAGVILTESAPAPQRLSSLFPPLAILAGAAVAGFLSLLPERKRWFPLRAAAGTVIVGGAFVASFRGFPPGWDPSPGYAGAHGAFLRSARDVLRAPRYAREPISLHGRPYIDSSFPLFPYFLPAARWIEVEPADPSEANAPPPAPGFHLFSPEWIPLAGEWRQLHGISRVVLLPDPSDPRRDAGALLRVP